MEIGFPIVLPMDQAGEVLARALKIAIETRQANELAAETLGVFFQPVCKIKTQGGETVEQARKRTALELIGVL